MFVAWEKGNSDALGKANARAGELEKQVEKLKKDLTMQVKDKEQLEVQADEVGKKGSDLNSKADKVTSFISSFKELKECNIFYRLDSSIHGLIFLVCYSLRRLLLSRKLSCVKPSELFK